MPNCEDVAVLAYAEETDALHGVSSTSINLPEETPVDNGTNLTCKEIVSSSLQKYVDETYQEHPPETFALDG